MKILNFYKTFLPLLLAIFTIGGSNANSHNSPVPNLDPRNYDYLQEDQNTNAHLFKEISIGGPLQVITKSNFGAGPIIVGGKGILAGHLSEVNKLTSLFIRDKKDILKTCIFPFHLFW